MSSEPPAGVHCELFVRSLAPRAGAEQQVAAMERLDRLVAEGPIDDYSVQVTGAAVPASPGRAVTEYGRYLLNRIAVFEEWAATHGLNLDPLFEHVDVDDSIMNRQRDVRQLPMVAMAEYEGQHLRFVAPCETDGGRVEVLDRLEMLAREEEPACFELDHARSPEPDPTRSQSDATEETTPEMSEDPRSLQNH
jgi:hypothetical protein